MAAPLYKVLKDGKSCNGGTMQWSLPENGTPGEWLRVEGDLKMCERGIHLTREPFRWWVWGADLYEADAPAIVETRDDKVLVREARLLRLLPKPDWLLRTERFVSDEIPSVPWLKPDGNPLPEWRMHRGKTWDAAGDAARDAARAAAGVAAVDAAWDAAGDAAVAATAGSPGARRLLGSLTEAAGAAAGAAARDAALMARLMVVADLPVDPKHFIHAAARWQVWQKGWGLVCDVNGVLYVYAPEEK